MKKIKKYKVGIDSETYAISLVEEPAIEEMLVALEKEEKIKVQLTNDEKHMVYSAVLVPDKPIYRRNEDGDEFYVEFTKESIEKMSQEFMQNYHQKDITIDHEKMASDITMVESWLKTDLYKDKSVALGLNAELPVGTWFVGMKINQIDVWERVKKGEIQGFSVESMISLEDFSKQEELNKNNMIDTNDEMFWSKLKNEIKSIFTLNEDKEDETSKIEIEPLSAEALSAATCYTMSGLTEEQWKAEVEALEDENIHLFEEQTETVTEPSTETAVEPSDEPKVEEPIVVPQEQNEAIVEPTEEPKQDTTDVAKLEELINNLKNEVEALKGMNSGLENKIKEMSKEPSAKPVNTNAKPNNSDTYSNWREQMRKYIG